MDHSDPLAQESLIRTIGMIVATTKTLLNTLDERVEKLNAKIDDIIVREDLKDAFFTSGAHWKVLIWRILLASCTLPHFACRKTCAKLVWRKICFSWTRTRRSSSCIIPSRWQGSHTSKVPWATSCTGVKGCKMRSGSKLVAARLCYVFLLLL
jgi:hypothetical protein